MVIGFELFSAVWMSAAQCYVSLAYMKARRYRLRENLNLPLVSLER